MQAADPCVECGGTELKLLDGYYYCVECNTQNTNARETVLEEKALGDGTFGIGTRRKIVKIHESKIQMSGEWYKWHAYNFILSGLADELIDAGAKSTFKLKLLWIWTRYVKKYQNKDALGQAKNTEDQNNDNLTLASFMVEENSSSNPAQDKQENNEVDNEEARKNIKKNVIMEGSKRDIKFFSKGVIIAMLYLALNLDDSDIQLYQLFRFIKEKRIDFSKIQRFVPDEIDLKTLNVEWLKFLYSRPCTTHKVHALALTLLRKLDLGTPKVPNMRKIIDDFLLELCLPNDVKPLIYSLMYFHHCHFLDISTKSKEHLTQTPDYEGVAMSYVLVAMKMCFGLDGDYEEKLSDAVDKINDERNLTKSYRMGKYSDPSTRLFSFREWCSYMQFRKITLCKSSLHMAEQHFLDIDDNVYIEHMNDRPQNKKELQDETAMNLLSKIPEEEEGRVIPKHLFRPTLTPMTDYTEIIIEHTQDPEIKALLSEDFTQYSLSYACEHLQLVDSNSENIIKGVSEDRKTVNKLILGTIVTKKSNKEMVYVKNCENRNWMITNPPKMEHVTCEDVLNANNDKESDHGYDSEHPVNEKEVCRETENVDENDQSMIKDSSSGNDSEVTTEKDISKRTENIDFTDGSINENNMVQRYSESLVNENEVSKETVNGSEKAPHETNGSKVVQNIDDSDESMNEDNIVLRYSETLVKENEVSKESEMLSKTAVNGTENQTNEKGVSEVGENIDDSDESMEKNSRGIHDTENLDDEEVSKKPESADENDQNMKEINDTENSANGKEVSEENENILQITDQVNKEDKRGFIITEEDDDKNIFDDLFIELDLKDEMEQNNEEDYYGDNEEPIPNNNSVFDDRASMSDVTDDDGVFATFNPDTFDREQTIRELILHACKKYKIPIPKEYKTAKEPRKRKANAFGDEETPREPRKRAKVNKFEAKRKVEELVSGYYSLKESDLLNQMQEAVSLAIRNNQFDGLLNATQNEAANIEQASDALTRASSFLTNNVENQSNVNPQTSLREQTDKEQNPDKTHEEEEQIDENWEAKLFEGEEETKLDDLVPKGDPKFDEDKYDVNQLYIKIKMEEKEDEYKLKDVPPKLEEILNQKIEQCKHSAAFANLKPRNSVKPKFESDSDSEDELPLNVLQEEKRLLEEKVSFEDNFEPLINKDNVSEFKYWFRHYDEDFMTRSMDWHKKFDEELKENTPSSFYFVIRECADILNSTTFTLYKHMQKLEKYIIARAKYPD